MLEDNNNVIADIPTRYKKSSTIRDFFKFHKMITPIIVKIIYLIGAISFNISLIVILIIKIIPSKFLIPHDLVSSFPYYYDILFQFERIPLWTIIISIILYNLIWRIVCETFILLFNIHSTLNLIEKGGIKSDVKKD